MERLFRKNDSMLMIDKRTIACTIALMIILTGSIILIQASVVQGETGGAEKNSEGTEPANYIMFEGVKGYEDKKFSSFGELYTELKSKFGETFGVKGEDGKIDNSVYSEATTNVDTFKKFFTHFVNEGETVTDFDAIITYKIHGTITYDESSMKYLISFGRAAARFSDNIHMGHFVIEGLDDTAKLAVKTGITLPYQWWHGDAHRVSLTMNNIEVVTESGTVNHFGVGVAYNFGMDQTYENVKFTGLGVYGYNNESCTFTANNCTFDGTGAGMNYALHIQGKGIVDKDGTPIEYDGKNAVVNLKNCKFSGYSRGINIDQVNAVAIIDGCEFSNKDEGRSSIQITQCSEIQIKNCTMNVVGNAFTLHENLKNSLVIGEVKISIENNTIVDSSKNGCIAHLIYSNISERGDNILGFEQLFAEKAKITFVGNTIDPTIEIEKGIYDNKESYVPSVILDSLKFKVTFDVDEKGEASVVEVGYGGTVAAPSDPSSDGYRFDGWYADKGLRTPFDFDGRIVGQTVVYAKWVASPVQSEGEAVPGFASGTGTADDPYVIKDEAQLRFLAESVNGGQNYSGKYFRLDSDIGLTSPWTPIGTEGVPFSGSFNGNGHVVSGLTITKTGTENTDLYLGLFGKIAGISSNSYTSTSEWKNIDRKDYGIIIENLTLVDVHIVASGSKIGALVGEVYDAYIRNVEVRDGGVIGTNSVGGIIGRGYGTIIDSCETGEDLAVGNGENNVGKIYNFGGIVGSLRKHGNDLSAVLSSTNRADVNAYLSTGGAAGIVGQVPNDDPTVVFNCRNLGDVNITGNPVIGNVYSAVAGGIGGQFAGQDSLIINCENHGSITSSSNNTSGALAGMANYFDGTIIGCINSGKISGNAYYAAGMVGHGDRVTIDGCVNTGEVTTSFENGYATTLNAGTSNSAYMNIEFDDVYSLKDALVKSAKVSNTTQDTGARMEFVGVSVKDSSGTLVLPDFLSVMKSDTKLCSKIVIGQRSNYTTSGNNIVLEIGIPDVEVELSGAIGVNDSPSSLTLSADNIDLTISKEGSIKRIAVNADGTRIVNLGSVGKITDYKAAETVADIRDRSGSASITIYNGTPDCRTARMESIEAWYTNVVVYNYGTMEYDGYLLSVGTACANPVIQKNAFTFYNHGSFIGKNVKTSDQNYMMYIPAAEAFTFYSYSGSKVVNYGNPVSEDLRTWFMYYGADGISSKDSSSGAGQFIWYYADNTVFRPNGSDMVSVEPCKEMWVGQGADDAKAKFIKMEESSVTVTFDDGFGNKDSVQIPSGTIPQAPAILIEGLVFDGWYIGDAKWDSGAVDNDTTLTARWAVAEPEATISGPTEAVQGTVVTFRAAVVVSPYLEYSYSWSVGDKTFSGSMIELTLGSGSTTVSLIVTAKPAQTYAGIVSGNNQKTISSTCDAIPVYTVAFDANGHGTAPRSQTVIFNTMVDRPDDPVASNYRFGGWYTESSCINAYDFSTPVAQDITLYAKWTYNAPTPPHIHSWDSGAVTKEPTCTEAGTKTYRCIGCGQTRTESIPATGHQWDSGTVTTPATEKSEGVMTYKCVKCGEVRTETIPKMDCVHVWNAGIVTKDPTCGSEGEMTYTCTKCDRTKTESIPATGNHSWDSGTVIKEPTETESGTIVYKCTVCGQTKSATVDSKKIETITEGDSKVTTETEKVTEVSEDGIETVIETETVTKEQNGKVTERKETTRSTTEKDGMTIVSETTVTETGGKKTESTVIAVESDDGKIRSDVSVSDGSHARIDTVITGDLNEDSVNDAIRQADVAADSLSGKASDVSRNITVPSGNATLSSASLDAISKSGSSLTISGDAGTIEIDDDVSESMMRYNDDIHLSITEKITGLTDAQKEKVNGLKVIELSARSSTADIHELGGKAQVTIFFTDDFDCPIVYWLKDDGSVEKVDAVFGDGTATIELSHFSLYYVAEGESSDSDSTIYMIAAIAIVAVVAVVGVMVYRSRTN